MKKLVNIKKEVSTPSKCRRPPKEVFFICIDKSNRSFYISRNQTRSYTMTNINKAPIADFVIFTLKGGKYVREYSKELAKSVTDKLDINLKKYPFKKFLFGVMRNDIDRRTFPIVASTCNFLLTINDKFQSHGIVLDSIVKSASHNKTAYQSAKSIKDSMAAHIKQTFSDLRGEIPWTEYLVEFIKVDDYLYMNAISCLNTDTVNLDTLSEMMAITNPETFSTGNMNTEGYGCVPCDLYAMNGVSI